MPKDLPGGGTHFLKCLGRSRFWVETENFTFCLGGGTLIFDTKLIFLYTIRKILRLRRATYKNIVKDNDLMSFHVHNWKFYGQTRTSISIYGHLRTYIGLG